jgi:hypothetical protein
VVGLCRPISRWAASYVYVSAATADESTATESAALPVTWARSMTTTPSVTLTGVLPLRLRVPEAA